jgi:ribulose-5-phosphate 4-epimerase/fuculose-1-phosphate aldolase
MPQQEGVVKYHLDYTEAPLEPGSIETLNAWRRIVYLLGGIGCDPARYGGYGYGNISCRRPHAPEAFIITGTQTGHLPELTRDHYVVVRDCDPERNCLSAAGPIKPSAESLTHSTVYDLDPEVQAVLHVHCPDIWRVAAALSIPSTAADVAYGTPAMARATRDLLAAPEARQGGVFAMAGHEDGVVTFGISLEQAGQRFIRFLAQALALEARR